MKRLVAYLAVVSLLGIVVAGCEPPKPVAGVQGPPAPPVPPPPPGAEAAVDPANQATDAAATAPGDATLPVETKVGVFAGNLDDLARGPAYSQPAPSATQPDDPNLERVKAGKGVGLKGRSLDEYEGVVVTPVKAYFAAKERIVFEIQFPSQYQIYKAMNDDVPKDFDDLKTKVLDPYQIKLPPLPPGHKYVWNAETEELQVERPKKR
jgi:hypothetical protein